MDKFQRNAAGVCVVLLLLGAVLAPTGLTNSLPQRANSWTVPEAQPLSAASRIAWHTVWGDGSGAAAGTPEAVDVVEVQEAAPPLISAIIVRSDDRYVLMREDAVGEVGTTRLRLNDQIGTSGWSVAGIATRRITLSRDGEERSFSPFGADRLVLERFLRETLLGETEVTPSE